jgi:hypothetical protein
MLATISEKYICQHRQVQHLHARPLSDNGGVNTETDSFQRKADNRIFEEKSEGKHDCVLAIIKPASGGECV